MECLCVIIENVDLIGGFGLVDGRLILPVDTTVGVPVESNEAAGVHTVPGGTYLFTARAWTYKTPIKSLSKAYQEPIKGLSRAYQEPIKSLSRA
jgi:hypothetical protein